MDQDSDARQNELLRQSRIPTRYLGHTPTAPRRRTALSRAIPPAPRLPLVDERDPAADVWEAQRATQRRRRLLAIFGRMMARFYDRHTRHWSMGRWACALCERRIIAWAWSPLDAPEGTGAMHEQCISRSLWDVVLHHEQLAQARQGSQPDAEPFPPPLSGFGDA